VSQGDTQGPRLQERIAGATERSGPDDGSYGTKSGDYSAARIILRRRRCWLSELNMPFRYTHLRKVDPTAKIDDIEFRPLSLWRAALAAAEETVHGAPIAAAWLQLFASHLSSSESRQLRWRDDLADSTEMRRTFSGLYARYFARALLASELGITYLIPLDRDVTQIGGGVTVTRVDGGDIPDWIGWDTRAGGYVLAEAKGRLSGSEQQFRCGMPRCVTVGKEQFKRVEVRNSSGRRVAVRTWIAAILWSTDERDRAPVSLLWDPPSDGDPLESKEIPRHAAAIRSHHNSVTVSRLGGLDFTVRIAVQPSKDARQPAEVQAIDDGRPHSFGRPASEPHESDYKAAVISSLGIRPIRNEADLQATQELGRRAKETGESVMFFGVADTRSQSDNPQQLPWLSDNGIASTDGLSLFHLADVEFKEPSTD